MAVGNIQYKKTKIGQIPEDWDVLKIGNVVQKASQRDPRKKPSSQFKYVDISSISNDLYKITDFQILTGKNAPSRAKKVIKLNDIIYATVRPYLKRIAIVPQELDNEICSTGFCVIRCDSKPADYRYIFYILLTEWLTQRLTDLQKGSSYPAITDKDIYSQFIPLPHISEQRKIVEVLSTVDADIEKTDAIIKETQQLKKGLMEKLFTEGIGHTRFKKTKIGRIPEEWEVEKLEKVVEFRNGSAHEKIITDDGKYVVINSKFISSDGKILKYANENLSPLHKGDIVMVMSDLPKGKALAKCFFIDRNETYTLNQRICSFNAIKVFNKFLYYFLNRNKYFLSFDNGLEQTNLRKDEVLGCPVALPPSQEQQKIATILSEIDNKIKNEQNYKSELEQLKKGLLQVLLTGKVRVKV